MRCNNMCKIIMINCNLRALYRSCIILTIILFGYLYAEPPNWSDNPGQYLFDATINVKIYHNIVK